MDGEGGKNETSKLT